MGEVGDDLDKSRMHHEGIWKIEVLHEQGEIPIEW
jgi:hypothetical protein